MESQSPWLLLNWRQVFREKKYQIIFKGMSQQDYDRLKKKLKDALNRKKEIDRQVTRLEEDIFNKETAYLSEGAQHGNIIKGFENFTKTTTSTSSSRGKKIQFTDEDRIFSLSSATYVRHLKKINSGQMQGTLNPLLAQYDDDDEESEELTPRKRRT
ncbi:hypothetical protein OGAPHI_001945 [Ogataea philodendri]|uniref:Chromatin modification-related protein EAF6 n=1 Tax=Ogataea philodendri TaxID=1378263 RepID=A0A9P8T6U7_9ASCO|nr:uncharacterized protein OGAPHI_001945 [Ogataea philodendri]KAH3668191.1 hypothetical protein OGAPHI_001945 [Ogataea philodendri]